jgi:N-acetylglucosamine-6-phosphate deacetylase
VEIIADGCHLPPDLIKLIVKLKGVDRVSLVTDSLQVAGTTDKESSCGTTKCIIEDGVCKLLDRSAFAGSIATTDRLVRVCVKDAGIPLTDAITMAAATPARVLGLNKGRIAAGLDADILFFDEDINVKCVFVGGESVYEA